MTFVFVLGSGRCGSSLVQEVLSRHSGVGFLSNLDDRYGSFGRFNNAVYRHVPQQATLKSRPRFAPSEGYRALEREVSPLVVAPGRTLTASDATPWLAGRFARFFEDRAARQARPVFLHKFTGWPRVGFIRRAFPDARFVNVIRDGRAVANSLVQMPWWQDYRDPIALATLPERDRKAWEASDYNFLLLAGLVWKNVVEAHEEASLVVDSKHWLDVRYEDVLTDPRREVGRMLEFSGLPWDARFEQQFSRQQLSPSRREAFRSDLSLEDVAMLDEALGDTLRRHGYRTGDLASSDAHSG